MGSAKDAFMKGQEEEWVRQAEAEDLYNKYGFYPSINRKNELYVQNNNNNKQKSNTITREEYLKAKRIVENYEKMNK